MSIFAVCFTLCSYAQTDTSKVEQYCSVNVFPRLLSNKVTIELDFGDFQSMWKDNRIKTETGSVKKFNSIIDALNYMGKQGWVLVNSMMFSGDNLYYSYVFKKLFPKTDLK